MGFGSLIRGGVALADSLTGKASNDGLQGTFTHEAWIGQSGAGLPTYAAGVIRNGVIDTTPRVHYTGTGILVVITATITVLEKIPDNGATGRVEPVDPRDRITLSDGTTAPIISDGGPDDPSTGRPYLNTIMIGQAPR